MVKTAWSSLVSSLIRRGRGRLSGLFPVTTFHFGEATSTWNCSIRPPGSGACGAAEPRPRDPESRGEPGRQHGPDARAGLTEPHSEPTPGPPVRRPPISDLVPPGKLRKLLRHRRLRSLVEQCRPRRRGEPGAEVGEGHMNSRRRHPFRPRGRGELARSSGTPEHRARRSHRATTQPPVGANAIGSERAAPSPRASRVWVAASGRLSRPVAVLVPEDHPAAAERGEGDPAEACASAAARAASSTAEVGLAGPERRDWRTEPPTRHPAWRSHAPSSACTPREVPELL